MPDLSRTLTILADGEPVTGFYHASLFGEESLGLYPLPFMLRIWNLSDPDYYLISSAGRISVQHDDSVLAAGTVSNVYRRAVSEGTVTEIVFSPGLPLWEAPVSLSVEAGATVSETVRRILSDSGTGISLLSFPGEDPVRTRGQAFFGRAAECVMSALSAAGARACFTLAGLCIVPSLGLPVSMTLSENDLIDAPNRVSDRLMVLRTRVAGWPLGKTVSVQWQGNTIEGLVIERRVDADNMDGPWQAELLIEVNV